MIKIALFVCAVAAGADAKESRLQSRTSQTVTNMRVDYLANAISIDSVAPSFSYALMHPIRGEYQTAYQIQVQAVGGVMVWDSQRVMSRKTLNIMYNGSALSSDTDYEWTVSWWDSAGTASTPVTSTFSTAFMNSSTDFRGAWIGSTNATAGDGGLNTYRTTFTVAAPVTRARLYLAGLGYFKAWVNGAIVDDHELGTFTTFERRVLYDVVDVTSVVQQGCNALGIMLGHGWFSQPTINSGPRQFLAMLSVTTADGNVTRYPSSLTAGASVLTFNVTAGPVIADDIYIGETFDGRVASALAGWSTCAYAPSPTVTWIPAVAPSSGPSTTRPVLASHPVPIRTDGDYRVAPGGPSQPYPGVYVYNFVQNMAGQVTLVVNDCPAGTVITMRHAEILWPNGTIHNHYLPGAPMTGVYICSGQTAVETYRTMFTYYGFQYVQVEGFPGVPSESTLTAHFVHSDLPQTGEFSSSSPTLNAVQHATRYAALSNLMDVPTDCPQRERRGWLGDAQLSMETVIHNFDGSAFYSKWLRDFTDSQLDNEKLYGAGGALPDCVPYYVHGHVEADPGWGIAVWNIADWVTEYYDDDAFLAGFYPTVRAYMEHWITLASANTKSNPPGLFPVAWWGDWLEFYPGPWSYLPATYADFFYVWALGKSATFATRLGIAADVQRYTQLLAQAQANFMTAYYNASTGCFANCMYVENILGLTLGVLPQGSEAESRVWNNTIQWFSGSSPLDKYPDHFGGGIVAVKFVYPLLDRFGLTGLGLKFQLQTDGPPAFGAWIAQGATTLWEAYDLTATGATGSYNHIMFGGSGSWYYSSLAGLARVAGSRSWSNLSIAPPTLASGVPALLSHASASIDTPMGIAAAAWSTLPPPTGLCGLSNEDDQTVSLTCAGGTFTDVVFASFGTPSGSCSAGLEYGECNASNTTSIVAAACIGKSSCNITASTALFGDPCVGTMKSLAVQLGGNCGASTQVYTLVTTVPMNAVAGVAVPTMGVPLSGVLISEGGVPVWQGGQYVPGAVGITGAVATADGQAVLFSVGGGSYTFVVSQV